MHRTTAENLAELHLVPLKGTIIANSYYRMAEFLWKLENGVWLERTRILNEYFRKGFELMGLSDEP